LFQPYFALIFLIKLNKYYGEVSNGVISMISLAGAL
jgi:hypothetical protein